MKKNILFLALITLMGIPLAGFAQTGDRTTPEAAEGKAIWQKFQAKEMTCANMKNDDFEALGEYFMDQMMGPNHAAMNTMMTQMIGQQGEEQMHAIMGKRMSGCDSSAAYPTSGAGFMPMMNMMMTGGMMGGMTGGGGMMGFGGAPFGWFGSWLGSLLMIAWWVFVILGIVALVKWLTKK